MASLLQDECGNRVEAQQSHLDALGLGVAASIKEDGKASQMEELQAGLQVSLSLALADHSATLTGSSRPLSLLLEWNLARERMSWRFIQSRRTDTLCAVHQA